MTKLYIIQILTLNIFIHCYSTLSGVPNYICIIDAGSSGYKINLYDIIRTKYKTSYIKKSLIFFEKVYYPLTRDIGNHKQLTNTLNKLTSNLNNSLRENNIKLNTVIVSINGTAGFRKETYNIGYSSFINIIKQHLSSFSYYSTDVYPITGSEEGYLLLKSVFFTDSIYRKEFYTYGAREIGGSSLQISLLLPSTLIKKYNKLLIKDVIENLKCDVIKVPKFYFNFQEYHILACSFEEMGVNDIKRKVNEYIIQNNNTNNKKVVSNNCVNKGIIYNATISNKNYIFNGNYNYTKCKKMLNEVFKLIIRKFQSEIYYISALNEELCKTTEKSHIHVLPVSNLEHIIEHFKVEKSKHLLKDLIEKTNLFCMKSLKDLKIEFKDLNENVLNSICINSNYIIQLLKKFYKMDVNIKNILRFKKLDWLKEKGVEWSMGASYKYLLKYLYIVF